MDGGSIPLLARPVFLFVNEEQVFIFDTGRACRGGMRTIKRPSSTGRCMRKYYGLLLPPRQGSRANEMSEKSLTPDQAY